MIYGERTRRSLHRDRKGMTGTIVMLCDWEDVDPLWNPELPSYGDPWPGGGLPYLRVVDIQCEEGTIGECQITYSFSTEVELTESFIDESIDVSLEPGDELDGWVWEDTGTPVQNAIAPSRPKTLITCRKRNSTMPLAVVNTNIGRVNTKRFRGIDAGYLRFEGAKADNSYDDDGDIISSDTVYTFSVRSIEHNQMWRKPIIARDSSGNELYWQNISSEEPYYTTDMAKIGTPVFINQITGQELNPAGVGAYSKPKLGTAYLHEACDFADVLSLPKKDGDE